MSRTSPILKAQDLDHIRIAMLGRGASLKFFSVTPSAGEIELFGISRGWAISRKRRSLGGDPSGSLTIIVSKQTRIDVEKLRENAMVDLVKGGETKRYRVVETTETQDLSSGWVLHVEPISGSV